MSFTVFLGNLPIWVTADDIKSWLTGDNLVADNIKVIRNPETQESKGFAFIEAPNAEEMNSIIRRFDRAPLEERLLRANPAQPPKGRTAPATAPGPGGRPGGTMAGNAAAGGPMGGGVPSGSATGSTTGSAPQGDSGAPPGATGAGGAGGFERGRRGGRKHKKAGRPEGAPSAFAEELAKAL